MFLLAYNNTMSFREPSYITFGKFKSYIDSLTEKEREITIYLDHSDDIKKAQAKFKQRTFYDAKK